LNKPKHKKSLVFKHHDDPTTTLSLLPLID